MLAGLSAFTLSANNLIPGDTSAETENATTGDGRFGELIYGYGTSRLAWDRSEAFDGTASRKALHPGLFSLKNSLPLKAGGKYTFSFYAKAARDGVRGLMNCVPSTLRQWPYPANGKNITFTKDWKRHAYTFTAADNSPYSGIYRVMEENEPVWFDAFQLEEGDVPTAYAPACPFTIGVSASDKPGCIYYTDEPLELKIAVRRFSGRDVGMLKLKITDRKGVRIAEYSKEAVFGKDGIYSFSPGFKAPHTGWFRASAEMMLPDGKSVASSYDFVVTTRMPKDASVEPFTGICSMYTPEEIFIRMGAKWRYYAQNFSYAAAQPGKITLFGVEALKKAKAEGLRVKLMINLHPPLRLMSGEEKEAMKKYRIGEERFVPDENADAAWTDFMRNLTDQFGPYVDVWEFGGEIDARFGLNPYYKNRYPDDLKKIFSAGWVAERVARLVVSGAEIIRKKYPDAVISAVRPCDVDCRSGFVFSSEVYKRAPGALNAFGIDSYAKPRRIGPKEPVPGPVTDLIEQYSEAQKVLDLAAPGKKQIFISEFGYELAEGAANGLSYLNLYSNCLAQSHLMARAAGFKSMAFYNSLGMSETESTTYNHWIGGKPLPSVAAYCHIARFLQNVNRAEFLIPASNIVVGMFGKTDGTACGAVWTCNPEDSPEAVMNILDAADVEGVPLALPESNGKMRFKVAYEPVFFYAKNYETVRKAVEGMTLINEEPLTVDFRMKTRNIVKMYLSSKSETVGVHCVFTFNRKKYDVIVPPGECTLLNLPVSSDEKKIVLNLDFPDLKQSMTTEFEIPKIYSVPKLPAPVKADAAPGKWRNYPSMFFGTKDIIYPIDVFGWSGKDDLSVTLTLAHDASCLYIFAAVKDDIHCNTHARDSVAVGDILQIAFDPLTNTCGKAKDKRRPDDTNIALALASGKPVPVFYYGPDKKLFEHSEYAVVRDEKSHTTFYEFKLPLKSLGMNQKGHVFGFSAAVFDDDSNTRWDYYMNLFPGITGSFDPSRFGLFTLEE